MSDGDNGDGKGPSFDAAEWRAVSLVEKAMAPRGIPVSDSSELQRIINLPRRPPVTKDSPTAAALVELMQRKYSRGIAAGACGCARIDKQIAAGNRTCITCLKWEQAWMLYEIELVGGLLANAAVGIGKTLLNILAPLALRDHVRRVSGGQQDLRHALLLVPPSLLGQIKTDYQLLAEHFRVPGVMIHFGKGKRPYQRDPDISPDGTPEPWLRIYSYNGLSGTENSDLLERVAPDAVIADECDALKDVTSSRVLRLLRYYENHEATTRFCGWTGSLTDSSVREFAHLSCLALRLGSPLPVKKRIIEEWSACLDAVPNPTPPGALIRLLEPGEGIHELRRALRRRMSWTPGFVMIEGRQVITTESGERVELDVRERQAPPVPERIQEALNQVKNFVRPDKMVGGEDDEIIEDQLERARTAREVASGMMYRWIFPRGEPAALKQQWFAARKAWHAELREKVLKGAPQLDSKKLCENAAMRAWGFAPRSIELPDWHAKTFVDWYRIKDQVKPKPKAERLDSYIVDDAARWAYEHAIGQCEHCAQYKRRGGIIWYGMREFAHWLAQRARELYGLILPIYGEGSGEKIIEDEDGSRSVIASLKSHGRGRNGLQFMFSHQLIAQSPANARMWQQCLDAETEILTDKGWLGIDAEWGDVRAAAYDIADGTVRWSAAERIERPLGDEKVFGIKNPHLDIRVTAGHRMICERYRRRGPNGRDGSYFAPREFVRADEMPTHFRLPIAGHETAPGVPLTDAELTFLGLFLTDGNLSPGNNVIRLFQSERYPEVIDAIERTVADCGFRARHSLCTKDSNFGPRSPLHCWSISKGSPKRLTDRQGGLTGWSRLEKYVDKNMNDWYEQVDARQLRVLLRGMWLGDGSKTAGTYEYDRYHSHTWNIATRRKVVADRIQSLCVRRGLRCNLAQQSSSGIWRMRISEDQAWNVCTHAGDTRPIWQSVSSVPSERVWCVEVETGAIITRRHGKVAIVGNCLGRLHRRGQRSGEVFTEIYLHTEDLEQSFEQAIRRGHYVEEIAGEAQKLLDGWEDDRDLDD